MWPFPLPVQFPSPPQRRASPASLSFLQDTTQRLPTQKAQPLLSLSTDSIFVSGYYSLFWVRGTFLTFHSGRRHVLPISYSHHHSSQKRGWLENDLVTKIINQTMTLLIPEFLGIMLYFSSSDTAGQVWCWGHQAPSLPPRPGYPTPQISMWLNHKALHLPINCTPPKTSAYFKAALVPTTPPDLLQSWNPAMRPMLRVWLPSGFINAILNRPLLCPSLSTGCCEPSTSDYTSVFTSICAIWFMLRGPPKPHVVKSRTFWRWLDPACDDGI